MNPPADGALYQFRVDRHLGPGIAAHFPELTLEHLADGSTLLYGPLPDQAALHGVLTRIRDLGLTLLSVRRAAE